LQAVEAYEFYPRKGAKKPAKPMSKSKKIEREFLLTDESVNVYGFRLMTQGYDLAAYKRNPIGYHMHQRDGGVLLKWEDFRTEAGSVYAKPVINLSHPRGQQTVDEIESGFLNAASVGHIVVLESTDDPKLMLPGQTKPTVTRWYNREASLVDIPGNMNALALYDAEEQPLNLADFSINKQITMNELKLTAAHLQALNLSDNADAAGVDAALQGLVAKAAKVEDLTAQLTAEQTARAQAETALADYKKQQLTAAVEGLISQGLADKKLTAELATKLKADYANNPDGLKNLIAALPAYQSITGAIAGAAAANTSLTAKSWDELDKAGKLEDLKAQDLNAFKAKFKERFGTDYSG